MVTGFAGAVAGYVVTAVTDNRNITPFCPMGTVRGHPREVWTVIGMTGKAF